jgi:hypothetical protein
MMRSEPRPADASPLGQDTRSRRDLDHTDREDPGLPQESKPDRVTTIIALLAMLVIVIIFVSASHPVDGGLVAAAFSLLTTVVSAGGSRH